MNEILKYTKDMFTYMLFTSPLIIFFRIILLKYMKKKRIKTTTFHEIGIIVFILFLVGLASQTVMPDFNISSNNGDINLELFKVFSQTYHTLFVDKYLGYFLINFLGNIVIFMPIGFFIPLLWNKKHPFVVSVFTGFLISLFIEISQLALPRRTDVDDVWLNTLGALLGFILFYILNKNIPNFVNKFKVIYPKNK